MVKQKKTYTVDDVVTLMGNSSDEQETSIVFERNSDKMSIWTSDNTMVTKLKKLMTNNPKEYKLVSISTYDGQPVAYEFEAPKKLLTLKTNIPIPTLTDEQRAAKAERMKAVHEARRASVAKKKEQKEAAAK